MEVGLARALSNSNWKYINLGFEGLDDQFRIKNENDIAILFANALENAVNASLSQIEEHLMIKIQSRYEQGQMIIRMENYFDGNILFDENGIPLYLKEGHGFGMKSILLVVKKYSGTALFTHENNIFTAGFMFFE